MLFPISRVQEHHQSRKRGRVYESDEFDFFDDTSMASEESKEGSVEAPPLNVTQQRLQPSLLVGFSLFLVGFSLFLYLYLSFPSVGALS